MCIFRIELLYNVSICYLKFDSRQGIKTEKERKTETERERERDRVKGRDRERESDVFRITAT